jgi:ribose transport system substrate-binding protein
MNGASNLRRTIMLGATGLGVILVSILLSGSGGSSAAAAGPKGIPAPPNEPCHTFVIGMLTGETSVEVLRLMAEGAKKEAAAKSGQFCDKVVVKHFGSFDTPKSLAQAEDFLALGADFMLMSPIEGKAFRPFVQKALAQGVPSLSLIGRIPNVPLLALIAGDEVGGSRAIGKWIIANAPNKEVAFILGTQGEATGKLREDTIRATIEPKGFKVVASPVADFLPEKANAATLDILTAHPNVGTIWAVNSGTALGALQALKQKGRVGKVALIGYNGDCQELVAVWKNQIQAVAVLDLGKVGRLGVDAALAWREGKGDTVKSQLIDTPLFTKKVMQGVLDGKLYPELRQRTERAVKGACIK